MRPSLTIKPQSGAGAGREAQEESAHGEDDRPHIHCGLHKDRGYRIRQNVAEDPRRTRRGLRGFDEVSLLKPTATPRAMRVYQATYEMMSAMAALSSPRPRANAIAIAKQRWKCQK